MLFRRADCVAEEKLSWKPHQKSMTMSRFASHIASIAGRFFSRSYGTISDFVSSIPCRSFCLPEGVIV
jgi:hypothetical protein